MSICKKDHYEPKADNSLWKKNKYNRMPVNVRYENNVLKPLEKLDLIEIIKSNADRIVGLLKDIDIDSVDLQHAARDI
jgi:predicted DNA-binding antitoxin AbrB/MazE fold protein